MTRRSVGVALGKAGGFVATRPDWILERLAKISTTNLRVFFTLTLATGTAIRYWTATDGWKPSLEWCGLILGLSGADVVQWTQKRRTQWRPEETRESEPDAN